MTRKLLGTIVEYDGMYCLELANAPNCKYPLNGSSGIGEEFRETFNEAGAHDVGKRLYRVGGAVDNCLQMENARQMEARQWAEGIKALGFTVYMASNGTYGFITDDKRERVLSFQFSDTRLSGNYGPPSRESGTGWVISDNPYSLRTADDVRHALYSVPPAHCGKGWKHYTTAEQYLSFYGPSSKYEQI